MGHNRAGEDRMGADVAGGGDVGDDDPGRARREVVARWTPKMMMVA